MTITAWCYELGHRIKGKEYDHWVKHLSFEKPNVPEGSIRNLIQLVAVTTDTSNEVVAKVCARVRLEYDPKIADLIASLSRQLAEARAVVKEHHQWHQSSGPIGLPDGKGGWIEIDNGLEYSDSLMCERTEKVLAGLPPDEAGPMPRGGVDAHWWQVAVLERRKNKKLSKELAEAQARIKELKGLNQK